MIRRILLSLAIAAVLAQLAPSLAHAQVATHRPVRRGDVTGVELGLEGGLAGVRGRDLRWLVTAYEVVGLSDLRPAPRARIRVYASFRPGSEVASAEADAFGRATIAIPLPHDAPETFRAVVEVSLPVGATRRFELDVRTEDPRALTVRAAPHAVRAGGVLRVLGRLADRGTGRGLDGARLELRLWDQSGRPLGRPIRLRTAAAGMWARRVRVPDDAAGLVRIEIRTPEEDGEEEDAPAPIAAETAVAIVETVAAPLLVAIAPERSVVAPRDRIYVDVIARRGDGRPVPGATVHAAIEREPGEPERPIVTDARGRARFAWRAPHVAEGFGDQAIGVRVVKAGVGAAEASATVRVAAQDWAAAIAVEGGAAPALVPARVYVRAVSIDGLPAGAGVPIEASGPRLGSTPLRATTDADGVAALDVTLARGDGATDPCGGEAATEVRLRIGEGDRAATITRCLPVDPDAAARVRVSPQIVAAGGTARVEITRARSAARLPVAVALHAIVDGGVRAIASHVVPGGESQTEIAIPEDAVGQLIVTARPLIGPAMHEVRGGTASLWSTPGPRSIVEASIEASGRTRVVLGGEAESERGVIAIALPIDEARALFEQTRGSIDAQLGDLRAPSGAVGETLIAAALAARTPLDVTAPAVLRDREVVPLPAPADPMRHGALRDPWRARARFVGGRLGLLFRAIERHVERSIPENLDHVASRSGATLRFNRQLLASLGDGEGLGAEGAAGLGGDPITIEALERVDPSFTFDNVARRITRERLFALLIALRQFVQQRGLDLRWAWSGEPSTWLAQLRGFYVPGLEAIEPRDLVDGWGRPFELRPAPGGRPRFAQLAPVAGYELVSSGPDGRFGTGDDMWSPTARVLPSRSLYADAVGEDALVARLSGVELGRATVQMAAGLFGAPQPYVPAPEERIGPGAGGALWSLPPVLSPDAHALALRRPSKPGDGAGAGVARIGAAGGVLALSLDEEPRTWGVVVETWTPEGFPAAALATVRAGAQALVDAELPDRLRTNEELRLALHVTNVGEEDATWSVLTDTDGPIVASASPSVAIPAGEHRVLDVALRGTAAGEGRVAIALRSADGRAVRTLARDIVVDDGLHPIRRRASGTVRDGAWEVELAIPAPARGTEARLVLLAPSALAADPDLADVRRDDPALPAWAWTLAGRALSPDLRAELLRAQTPDGLFGGAQPALSTSAAIVALSAAGAEDEEAMHAREHAVAVIDGLPPFVDRDPTAARIRTDAAVLAALASGAVLAVDESSAPDPVAAYVAALRPRLRRALHEAPAEPTLLARAAGALLLADPRDGHGLAMLERAARRLERAPGGGLVVPASAERRDASESQVAALALAIAAHQANRPDLARSLVAGATTRLHVLHRLGGEATFWLLAAGAYGAMGAGAPSRVEVTIDGRTRTVDLSSGRAVVPIEAARGGSDHDVRVRAEGRAAVLARVEAVFARPFDRRQQGPLAIAIDGDLGRADEIAALELSVQARTDVAVPVVDLQLPAGVDPDRATIDALRATGLVTAVERRRPGFVRITLAPMRRGQRVVLPLPIAWGGHGDLRGLAAVAYPAARPEAMTVIAPRRLRVAAPGE